MHQSTSTNDRYMALKKIGVGPGGLKCRCCAPPRCIRKMLLRTAKRVAKREALKDQVRSFQYVNR